MIATLLGGAMGAAIVTTLFGGLLLWLRHHKLDAAQVDDTAASADERRANATLTDLEAWEQMRSLRTGLIQDLADLQTDVRALREENRDVTDRFREAIAHIVKVHEWDAGGRVGPMPTAPVELVSAAS